MASLEYTNAIYHTVPHETIRGVVWIVETKTGEKIHHARDMEDILFIVGSLMRRRIMRLESV